MRVKHKTQGWFKFFCMINSRSDLLAKQKTWDKYLYKTKEEKKREEKNRDW
jgi:hypothetical protein